MLSRRRARAEIGACKAHPFQTPGTTVSGVFSLFLFSPSPSWRRAEPGPWPSPSRAAPPPQRRRGRRKGCCPPPAIRQLPGPRQNGDGGNRFRRGDGDTDQEGGQPKGWPPSWSRAEPPRSAPGRGFSRQKGTPLGASLSCSVPSLVTQGGRTWFPGPFPGRSPPGRPG